MRSVSLVSICLLVVLASGAVSQIIALPTEWTVSISSGLIETDVDVNGMPYCILPDDSTLSTIQSEAASIQSEALKSQQVTLILDFAGYVHEGTCDDPGSLVGPIAGTLTVELRGSEASDLLFTTILVFDVGPGLMSYHSEAKLTGVFQFAPCALKNVMSEYAFVRGTGLGGIGLNLDLQFLRLEPESGECSTSAPFWLPTFVFSIPSVAVGGLVMPASMLALVAPWLAVIGVVGCISTVVVVARKREK